MAKKHELLGILLEMTDLQHFFVSFVLLSPQIWGSWRIFFLRIFSTNRTIKETPGKRLGQRLLYHFHFCRIVRTQT
jgi:hypothetical protein